MDEAELKRLGDLCTKATDAYGIDPAAALPMATALPAALAEIRRLKKLNEHLEDRVLEESAERSDALTEVARLRGLVKAAEWSGDGMHEGFVGCNWCSASYDHGGGADIAKHAADCPAFAPDGGVR